MESGMPLVPEYEALLANLAAAEGPPFSQLSPDEGRAIYRMMRPLNPDIAVGRVADTSVPGPAGDIPVRVYTPQGAGPFPVLVNFHGGGWVIGDLDTADAVCRDLCGSAGCVVVSVAYRLAPEHRYPAAVEDAWAATTWVAKNMSELHGNGRLAVGGESAGGNLAAVVCLWARDRGGPKIHFQLLLYPVTDHDFERDSYRANGKGYILELDTMRWFWDHYCPEPLRRAEPNASPLRAANMRDLPPALVVTAEFDPLRDEGEAYARALRAAGNQVEVVRYDGLVHDFLATAAMFEPSRRGFESTARTLRAHLEG
jgi:acetyl esterase